MDKSSGGSSLGFIVVLLVWGALLYTLFYDWPWSSASSGNFSASIIESAGGTSQTEEAAAVKKTELKTGGIISVGDDKNNFQNAIIHFDKKINISDIIVSPAGHLMAASDNGLFISRDQGVNWYSYSDLERKIDSGTYIYKILFNSSNLNEIFISVFKNKQGFIYKSSDQLFSLDALMKFDNEAAYDMDIVGDNLYLGLSDGRLLIYSLENNTFRSLANLNDSITNIEIDYKTGTIYLTLKSGKLLVSENGGANFASRTDFRRFGTRTLSFSLPWNNAPLNDFWINSQNGNYLYAVGRFGFVQSFDAGKNWKTISSLPNHNQEASAMALIDSPSEIYIAFDNKIYKSQNEGKDWQVLEPSTGKRTISVIQFIEDKIIVGTEK